VASRRHEEESAAYTLVEGQEFSYEALLGFARRARRLVRTAHETAEIAGDSACVGELAAEPPSRPMGQFVTVDSVFANYDVELAHPAQD
jgi:hypothetical protein